MKSPIDFGPGLHDCPDCLSDIDGQPRCSMNCSRRPAVPEREWWFEPRRQESKH